MTRPLPSDRRRLGPRWSPPEVRGCNSQRSRTQFGRSSSRRARSPCSSPSRRQCPSSAGAGPLCHVASSWQGADGCSSPDAFQCGPRRPPPRARRSRWCNVDERGQPSGRPPRLAELGATCLLDLANDARGSASRTSGADRGSSMQRAGSRQDELSSSSSIGSRAGSVRSDERHPRHHTGRRSGEVTGVARVRCPSGRPP